MAGALGWQPEAGCVRFGVASARKTGWDSRFAAGLQACLACKSGQALSCSLPGGASCEQACRSRAGRAWPAGHGGPRLARRGRGRWGLSAPQARRHWSGGLSAGPGQLCRGAGARSQLPTGSPSRCSKARPGVLHSVSRMAIQTGLVDTAGSDSSPAGCPADAEEGQTHTHAWQGPSAEESAQALAKARGGCCHTGLAAMHARAGPLSAGACRPQQSVGSCDDRWLPCSSRCARPAVGLGLRLGAAAATLRQPAPLQAREAAAALQALPEAQEEAQRLHAEACGCCALLPDCPAGPGLTTAPASGGAPIAADSSAGAGAAQQQAERGAGQPATAAAAGHRYTALCDSQPLQDGQLAQVSTCVQEPVRSLPLGSTTEAVWRRWQSCWLPATASSRQGGIQQCGWRTRCCAVLLKRAGNAGQGAGRGGSQEAAARRGHQRQGCGAWLRPDRQRALAHELQPQLRAGAIRVLARVRPAGRDDVTAAVSCHTAQGFIEAAPPA